MTHPRLDAPRVCRRVRVEVDRGTSHPEWDAWVAATPGGHHLQTSSWAHVEAAAGWRAARVMLSSDGELVAGCQLFVRDLPLIGGVACVPRGPLLSARAPDLLDQLLAAMRRFAREEGIFCISLEPPVGCDELPAQLQTRGLTRSALQTVPCAGVQVNLSGHPDEARVFGALPSETRRRVCEAQAHGVVVRVTRERDLHLLSTLLAASAAPEARPTQPNDYYRLLWRAFSGQAQLQVAEHEGRPLSASLLIRFGDTVSCVAATWGAARDGPPGAEELMHWTAIRRAHAGGFRH